MITPRKLVGLVMAQRVGKQDIKVSFSAGSGALFTDMVAALEGAIKTRGASSRTMRSSSSSVALISLSLSLSFTTACVLVTTVAIRPCCWRRSAFVIAPPLGGCPQGLDRCAEKAVAAGSPMSNTTAANSSSRGDIVVMFRLLLHSIFEYTQYRTGTTLC